MFGGLLGQNLPEILIQSLMSAAMGTELLHQQ